MLYSRNSPKTICVESTDNTTQNERKHEKTTHRLGYALLSVLFVGVESILTSPSRDSLLSMALLLCGTAPWALLPLPGRIWNRVFALAACPGVDARRFSHERRKVDGEGRRGNVQHVGSVGQRGIVLEMTAVLRLRRERGDLHRRLQRGRQPARYTLSRLDWSCKVDRVEINVRYTRARRDMGGRRSRRSRRRRDGLRGKMRVGASGISIISACVT